MARLLLDQLQQPSEPLAAAHRVGRSRRGGSRPGRLLPGELQPSVLGGRAHPAADVQRPYPVPEVLHQTATDLGAHPGRRVVGHGHAVHETALARADRKESGLAQAGRRSDATSLCALSGPAGFAAQLPRRNAPHARQARGAGIPLPSFVAAEGRRRRVCPGSTRRQHRHDARCHHCVHGR